MKRAVLVTVAALTAGPAAACEATKAGFDRVKQKMTLTQVEAAVGCSGEMLQESEGGGERIVTFKWDGAAAGSSLIVMLQNDRLTNKAQFGLR